MLKVINTFLRVATVLLSLNLSACRCNFVADYLTLGIWVSPPPTLSDQSALGQSPVMTLLGSTNLSARSANLDTELSFVMLTSSPSLRAQLRREVEGLHGSMAMKEEGRSETEGHIMWTKNWRGDDDSLPGRKVRLGTRMLVGMVGGML
jgi:CDP-diacylglycerol---glycerol-3-phosphate 3-phosphatidyltransferase